MTGCGTRSASLRVHRNLFWQLSRDGNSQGILEGGRRHGLERKCWMDNIKQWTSLPVPELLAMASCRMINGREYLQNRLSCPPDEPIGQGTELRWTAPRYLAGPEQSTKGVNRARQTSHVACTEQGTQQQRPESPTVTLTWHACKRKL